MSRYNHFGTNKYAHAEFSTLSIGSLFSTRDVARPVFEKTGLLTYKVIKTGEEKTFYTDKAIVCTCIKSITPLPCPQKSK